MTLEEIMSQKEFLLNVLKEVENEAGWLADQCHLATLDLLEVKTEEDAEAWDKKYGNVEDKLKHIELY